MRRLVPLDCAQILIPPAKLRQFFDFYKNWHKKIATYAEHKWRSCFITPVGAIFLRSASDLQADAGEEGAWGGGAIDVARIAVHALVQVALEMVEQVLHTRVHLQRIVLIQRDIVAQLHIPLEENRRFYLLVLLDITREVLHQHAARQLAVGDDMEMLDWFDIAEEIAIVVRRLLIF